MIWQDISGFGNPDFHCAMSMIHYKCQIYDTEWITMEKEPKK